jgi:tetratricopeptide (TPR) repeat protein
MKTRMNWAVALACGWLAGCATPQPQFTDADWVSHSTTGRDAHGRGDYRRAGEAYARAQLRAQALDDAEALAVASANRAVCLLAEGQAAEARAALADALADARVSAPRRADLCVAEARALLALGDSDGALAAAERAARLDSSPSRLAQAALVRSGALLEQGDAEAAHLALQDGLAAKRWNALPLSLQAEREVRLGQIAEVQGQAVDAQAAYDRAAATWREAGRLPEMARALAQAGRQARTLGEQARAADRLYRASRSLWAQGLGDVALSTLAEAVACAAEAGDEDLGRRMAEWVAQIGADEAAP